MSSADERDVLPSLREQDQELAQEELRSNRALLRALFDNSIDGLLLADDTGRHVDANRAACELTGMTRDELLT